jgi:hypothetical protein
VLFTWESPDERLYAARRRQRESAEAATSASLAGGSLRGRGFFPSPAKNRDLPMVQAGTGPFGGPIPAGRQEMLLQLR